MLDAHAVFAAHPSAKALRHNLPQGRIKNVHVCSGCGAELPWHQGRVTDHEVMRQHLFDVVMAEVSQRAAHATQRVMVTLGCEVGEIEGGGSLCLTHEVESPGGGPLCALAESVSRAVLEAD